MKRHRRTVQRRMPQWPIVAILALAFALRVYRLTHLSLWLDEGYSAFAAGLPWPDLLQFVVSRAHPPLYFLLLHGWAWLGQADFILRFLSVLWGLVGVAGLYALGRRLLSQKIGLLAALLLAVSPMHVWHSQDARMYSQLFALAILSTYLLVRAVDEDRLRYWLGYALLATSCLYTHNTAFLTIGAQVVFGLGLLAIRREGPGPPARWREPGRADGRDGPDCAAWGWHWPPSSCFTCPGCPSQPPRPGTWSSTFGFRSPPAVPCWIRSTI